MTRVTLTTELDAINRQWQDAGIRSYLDALHKQWRDAWIRSCTVGRTAGKIIPFYVPAGHSREKYERRIGKPASLTVLRLRGRELEFPSGRLKSYLGCSEDNASRIERRQIIA